MNIPQNYTSINPANDEELENYPFWDLHKLEQEIQQSSQAQKSWTQKTVSQRIAFLPELAKKLLENKLGLARQITLEMGKPFNQAISEIEKCAQLCDYYFENTENFLQDKIISQTPRKAGISFRPLGSVFAIMPWNYPFWQVFRCALPTLITGNAFLLKHAPNVLGCAKNLEKIFLSSGLPEKIYNTLFIHHSLSETVIADRSVQAISLTGSTQTGKKVAQLAGKYLKKCLFELGGSDPFIVLKDANLDHAVESAITARFQNTGQSCIAAKRFIVVEKVLPQFEEAFLVACQKLKYGDPMQNPDLGPMARKDLRDHLHQQVLRSMQDGAQLKLGGKLPEDPGSYYPATLLTAATPKMTCAQEELFGPVASILSAKDENEAIEIANQTSFGLGASLWTQDLEKGEQIAKEKIHAGLCFVNSVTKSDPKLPFGGVLQSGYGRELSYFGLHELTNIKSFVIQA